MSHSFATARTGFISNVKQAHQASLHVLG